MPGKPPVGQKGIGGSKPPSACAAPSEKRLWFALFGVFCAGFGLGFLARALGSLGAVW